MRFSEDYLRDVRDNNDIISLAGNYVQLKRAGSTYSCCCPFHSEKTPSCHFYPNTNSFYCFGCHMGGDVITFVKEIEHLDYVDAVKFLAERAGMSMPDDVDDKSAQKRRRLLEINKAAGKFFHERLMSPEGKAGLDYLTNRGLSLHTIKRFGLGFAADDWHTLHMYMRGLGYSDFELADASLLSNNNNKFYDKFRNRVMFPIFDTRGNVVAFGGRTLGNDKAKYLNSGETAVFHKGDMLYALNIAKNTKADYFILCEGYMDVIAMHQAGFDSAVASLGTALTPQHANLLARLGKKEVILSYDSDAAGQNASSRAINLLANVGVHARVLKIEGAKDPDEFIKKYGGERFQDIIDKSGGAIDFQMDKLIGDLDLYTDDGKAQYLRRVVPFLAEIGNSLDRAVYIARAAKQTGIPQENISTAVESKVKSNKRKAKKEEQKSFLVTARDNINPTAVKLPREEKAERGIICFLFHNPEKYPDIQNALHENFVTDFNKKVYDFLAKLCQSGLQPDISAFNEEFNGFEMGRIKEITEDKTFAFDENALRDFINVLNEYKDSAAEKPAEEMTGDDLNMLAQRLKEKR
ncbi:MAG: DNA primase [Oscillospiraceae bacterium]|nr:DNA primase [Oscillospiraceae bacterium]